MSSKRDWRTKEPPCDSKDRGKELCSVLCVPYRDLFHQQDTYRKQAWLCPWSQRNVTCDAIVKTAATCTHILVTI